MVSCRVEGFQRFPLLLLLLVRLQNAGGSTMLRDSTKEPFGGRVGPKCMHMCWMLDRVLCWSQSEWINFVGWLVVVAHYIDRSLPTGNGSTAVHLALHVGVYVLGFVWLNLARSQAVTF